MKKYLMGNILIFLSILIISSIIWGNRTFSVKTLNQIVFHLKVPMEGTDNGIYLDWFIYCVPISIILTVIINLFIFKLPLIIELKTYFTKIGIICLISALLFAVYNYQILSYGYNMVQKTDLYEKYYVAPQSAKLNFTNKKRNLIHIYLESVENTYAVKESGGAQKMNYIPELTNLAQENINFSNTDKIGGSKTLEGTQWTIASQVSQDMGIPLKLSIKEKKYDNDTKFLSGGYAIGEILAKQGYVNEFMCGSDADFGGTSNFYQQHGNYIIRDYNSFKENNEIPEDYFVFWGIEDAKLFEFAKKDLTALANKNKPFNFELATIDTHTPDGYICDKCQKNHKNQYANVIECQSRQVNEFVNWCKQQQWYENTTIVITGDHNSMSEKFFKGIDTNYVRTPYNCFINSAVEPVKMKDRLFSTIDMYPTILASLGIEIEGERLGLGTNLFSDKATLIEEIGFDKLNAEIQKTSKYYEKEILQEKGFKN